MSRNEVTIIRGEPHYRGGIAGGNPDTKKRLDLMRNNYLVWAITSGSTEHGKRFSVTPQRKHLDVLQRTRSLVLISCWKRLEMQLVNVQF